MSYPKDECERKPSTEWSAGPSSLEIQPFTDSDTGWNFVNVIIGAPSNGMLLNSKIGYF